MCGSGAVIGTMGTITQPHRIKTRKEHIAVRAVCCAGAPGTTTTSTTSVGRLIASGSIPSTGATISVFVLPGTCSYTLILLHFNSLTTTAEGGEKFKWKKI